MPSPMIKATLAAAALSSTSNVLAQFFEAYRAQQPLAFDAAQFARFVVLALLTCPPNYMWQQFLERRFPAYERRGHVSDLESQRGGGGGGGGVIKEKMDDYDDRHHHHPPGGGQASAAGGAAVSGAGPGPGEVDGGHARPKLNIRNTLLKWFIDCITLGAVMNTVAFFVLMGILKRQDMAQISHNVRTQTIPLIVAGYKIWPFASIISFSCVPVERRIVFLNFVGLLWGIYMSLVAARV